MSRVSVWEAETSAASEDWNEDNQACGQCAVTALLIQDLFGGPSLVIHDGIDHGENIGLL